MLTTIVCSVCGIAYDSNNHKDIADHDKECSRDARQLTLEERLKATKRKAHQIEKSLERSSSSAKRLNLPILSNRQDFGMVGAYTPSMLCGKTSTEMKFSSSHSVSRKSSMGKAKARARFDVSNKSSRKSKTKLPSNGEGTEKTSYEQGHSYSSTFIHSRNDNSLSNCNTEFASHHSSFESESDLEDLSQSDDNINDQDVSDDESFVGHVEPNPNYVDGTDIVAGYPTSRTSLIDSNSTNLRGIGPIIVHSSRERKFLELAQILSGVNTPLHVYDQIVKWARLLKEDDLDLSISYHNLVRQTAKKYGLSSIFPEPITTILPSQNAVKVTKFKFVEQMYSLLSDEELMQPQNLIFGDDPFARVGDHGRNHSFGDIETSSWYKRTQQSVCRNRNEVLMPIILFCDKTYVKSKPAEALSFTFGILKSHTRNNPRAWRNLGMIPGKLGDLIPQGKYNKGKKGQMRLNDWHHVCSILLTDLKQMQQNDGIDWEFFGKRCVLKIPIMFIIGDIEGHDKICSRKSGHNKRMKHVTHSCKVRRHECGHPETECEYCYDECRVSSNSGIRIC